MAARYLTKLGQILIRSRKIESSVGIKERIIEAYHKGKYLGRAAVTHGARNKSVRLADVKIHDPKNRGKGVGSAIFRHIEKTYGRAGYKFIRSREIMSAAQVKIRSKRKSKFILQNIGPFEDKTKLSNVKEAMLSIKNQKGIIGASTRIPKKDVKTYMREYMRKYRKKHPNAR